MQADLAKYWFKPKSKTRYQNAVQAVKDAQGTT